MAAASNESNVSNCGNKNTVDSTLFFDVDPYGGIPSNLIINVAVFIFLLFIFLIFHKKAYQSVNEVIRSEHLHKHSNGLKTTTSDEVQDLSSTINKDEGDTFRRYIAVIQE